MCVCFEVYILVHSKSFIFSFHFLGWNQCGICHLVVVLGFPWSLQLQALLSTSAPGCFSGVWVDLSGSCGRTWLVSPSVTSFFNPSPPEIKFFLLSLVLWGSCGSSKVCCSNYVLCCSERILSIMLKLLKECKIEAHPPSIISAFCCRWGRT